MKKILVELPESKVITLNEAIKKEFPLIGFLHNSSQKGFLVPVGYYPTVPADGHIRYSARAMPFFAKGNGWELDDFYTLEQWVKFFGKNAEFYLFEDEKELFKWLSE